MSILAGWVAVIWLQPGYGPPAVVAQPQADEVAAAGLGVIVELGAAVAERPVVDELDLARLEVEIDRKAVIVENLERRGDRGGAFVVDRLALQRVAAIDLVHAEPCPQFVAVLEHRSGEISGSPGRNSRWRSNQNGR